MHNFDYIRSHSPNTSILAEAVVYSSPRTWGDGAGAGPEVPSIQDAGTMLLEETGYHQSDSDVNPLGYYSDWPGRICLRVQWWRQCYGRPL